jgi:acyl carrier protein
LSNLVGNTAKAIETFELSERLARWASPPMIHIAITAMWLNGWHGGRVSFAWRVCAMSEQDAGRTAHRKFAVSSAIETGLSQINDPKQGARLVRAFLRITDPTLRLAIVQMVEKVGSAPAESWSLSFAAMLGNSFGEDDMARDLDAIRAWLTERISKALKVKGAMDPDAPLSKYGLQSIDAVILAMEIEEEVGVELPPTLLWEHNTTNECAAYLMTLGPAIAAWQWYRSRDAKRRRPYFIRGPCSNAGDLPRAMGRHGCYAICKARQSSTATRSWPSYFRRSPTTGRRGPPASMIAVRRGWWTRQRPRHGALS